MEKTFSGQILCSCAFGANIRSYTKQRAQHGTPFLQPPPPSFGGHPCHPPPPPPQSNFQVAQNLVTRGSVIILSHHSNCISSCVRREHAMGILDEVQSIHLSLLHPYLQSNPVNERSGRFRAVVGSVGCLHANYRLSYSPRLLTGGGGVGGGEGAQV